MLALSHYFVVGLDCLSLLLTTELMAQPRLDDFATPGIPFDGLDASESSDHWIWAQADGRFSRVILTREDIRAGAGPMLDGTKKVRSGWCNVAGASLAMMAEELFDTVDEKASAN